MQKSEASILIVDDRQENLMLLKSILKKEGYQVRAAVNGNMALESVKAELPDLILLDIMMPVMSGFEVCRQLKEDETTREIPVIFLSAMQEPDDKVKAFTLGGVDYITKPFEAKEVLSRVKAHLTIRQLQEDLAGAKEKVEERVDARTKEIKLLSSYLQDIIDSMPSALLGVDEEGKITHFNEEAGKMTVMPEQSILGQKFKDVFPDLAVIFKGLGNEQYKQFQKNKRLRIEKNNEITFFDVMVYPLKAAENSGAVIRIDDVTTLVQMEQMLVESDKMITIGGLSAGMAHEINNPLSVILMALQMLDRNIEPVLKGRPDCGFDTDAVKKFLHKTDLLEYLMRIRNSAERAVTIMRNMLNFSHKSTAMMLPYNLAELLDKTIEFAKYDAGLREKLDFRNIKLVKEYDPKITNILCHETEMQQVVLNLLKNASQAMADHNYDSQKPQIILRTKLAANQIRIDIEDNGPGMPAKTRDHIFEPFFTSKEAGSGTGLGLFLCHHIVAKNHKGKMLVDSAPGKGTKFSILLPLDPRNFDAETDN